MQRRSLLRLGLVSATLLAVAGGGVALFKPGWVDGRLSPGGRRVFKAVAAAVLEGSVESDLGRGGRSLPALLDRLDSTVAALPPHAKADLSRLLGLLDLAAGRLAIAGLTRDWPEASTDQVRAALQAMRESSVSLRQQAYHALRDLSGAAFYAAPATWPLLKYPGPTEV